MTDQKEKEQSISEGKIHIVLVLIKSRGSDVVVKISPIFPKMSIFGTETVQYSEEGVKTNVSVHQHLECLKIYDSL